MILNLAGFGQRPILIILIRQTYGLGMIRDGSKLKQVHMNAGMGKSFNCPNQKGVKLKPSPASGFLWVIE